MVLIWSPLVSDRGISGITPFEVSNRPPLRVGRFTPPRRPLIPDNGHLVGHYPLHVESAAMNADVADLSDHTK